MTLFSEYSQNYLKVEVWLPIPINRPLSYVYEGESRVLPGARVVVPLKGKKLLTGIVWATSTLESREEKFKPVMEVLDEEPFIPEIRRQFLSWLSHYYGCSLGEVLLAGIPAPFRPGSESYLHILPDFAWEEENLTSEELWVFRQLKKKGKLPVAELLGGFSSNNSGLKLIRKWQEEHRILILDELIEKFPVRSTWFIGINESFRSEAGLDALFLGLEGKPDEEGLMLRLLSLSKTNPAEDGEWMIPKESFSLNPLEKRVLARLKRRGIVCTEKRKVLPFFDKSGQENEIPPLSKVQNQAYQEVLEGFESQKPVLLMGVTGSGKTEIYMHLISSFLEKELQVLLLLPEIGITIQMVNRLRQVFGSSMAVYHSKTSVSEKLEVWNGLESGQIRFVIGVRSAVFLPLENLGLVIVDEEHDSSYKQAEPAPRYHGRDAAIYLAHLHGASVLMGSATPAVESFHHAQSGKWHFVKLLERYGNAVLPEIRFVDTRKAQRALNMKLDFSVEVLENLERIHSEGKQAIVFQNRRGYAPYLECGDCGWIPYCPYCDVSLTYHQSRHSLNCHYCGHHTESPRQCHDCGSVNLQTPGYGTEKLEESLGQLIPQLRIARMDQDTTSSRKTYELMLNRMQHGEIDVLIGTQMVTKGLDFENVTLVAVFDVDRVLHYPEFKANERTFQLLSQIAGRAGRREKQGLVLVQTHVPHHPLYRMVAQNEIMSFYEIEVEHRKRYGYPPFSRLIKVVARNPDQQLAYSGIEILARRLKKSLGESMILGPEAPVIPRLRNQFIFHLFLKVLPAFSPTRVKEVLLAEIQLLQSEKDCKKIQWIVDVDPG